MKIISMIAMYGLGVLLLILLFVFIFVLILARLDKRKSDGLNDGFSIDVSKDKA